MLLLCTVCFFLPFALRGAKLSLQGIQNNVADWLPDHYVETVELKEFGKYFDGGDRFLVLTGPWCKEGNPTFEKLRRKIREESLEYESVLRKTDFDELQAHRVGDKLGLLFADSYHEDWGEQREKWLKGSNNQWYFITRQGYLYRWGGQNNVIEGIQRSAERSIHGKNKVDKAYFIQQFGLLPGEKENEYYANPRKLFCRPFKSVISGPEILEQMSGAGGTLRIGKGGEEQEKSTLEARIEAHKRLTGSLFGPTPSAGFEWTFNSLLREVDQTKRDELLGARIGDPELREKHKTRVRQAFDRFVNNSLQEDYDSDLSKLCNANQNDQLELWYRMWFDMGIEAPARQTSLVVTLNEPVMQELARVIGRPILGKPRGRLLELAIGICGISPENVRIGGPPSDNVAIDEEGTNTLVRLAGLSLIIGITLAYLSFSSIRVALMLFFVGGMSAIASLAYVWFGGYTMDAILMSMPSLVYVLGLSSAVHIVNYYRDACYEAGPKLAVEKAVSHSLVPCSIAAFTTALGLFSLMMSNLTPIYKFGLFSGIAVMATVVLLFAYLPSALYIWPAGYDKKDPVEIAKETGITAAVSRFWSVVGNWVVRNHWFVSIASVAALIFFAVGVARIETSVHLLKLFDTDAKILKDYGWIEENLGKLVPAEIAPTIEVDAQQEPFQEAYLDNLYEQKKADFPEDATRDEVIGVPEYSPEYLLENDLKYTMLERVELSRRVRQKLERYFGQEGLGIIGAGMSMDVFTPLYQIEDQVLSPSRILFAQELWRSRKEMLEQDYYAVVDGREERTTEIDPNVIGPEIWRVSIRLGGLTNIDYGQFVNDLKAVVEPIMTAYRSRTELLKTLQEELKEKSLEECKVLVLGRDPDAKENKIRSQVAAGATISELIDQTYIFSDTLQDLLENRGITRKKGGKRFVWADPDKESVREKSELINSAEYLQKFDCVVLIEDDSVFDLNSIIAATKSRGDAGDSPVLLDFRQHRFEINPETKQPLAGMFTAKEKLADGDENVNISAMYTGIVPIVYKAQRSLLQSLIESIGLAFILISIVMMLLLRPQNSSPTPGNLLNFRGGLISMLPNMFPVIIVFGCMGHLNRWFGGSIDSFLVDIGSMMTASVAMGVAVDDTIHYLNWYRGALAKGFDRKSAIKIAYDRVATAMTQTTLIGGFGLSAFALSTFTPTQRFGVLMLILLAMALIGDLILLPALIAGPFGKYFGKERPGANPNGLSEDGVPNPSGESEHTLRIVENENANSGHKSDLPEVVLPSPEAM